MGVQRSLWVQLGHEPREAGLGLSGVRAPQAWGSLGVRWRKGGRKEGKKERQAGSLMQ